MLTDLGMYIMHQQATTVNPALGYLGAIPWTAPELLNATAHTAACPTDIYAFGMTTYEVGLPLS